MSGKARPSLIKKALENVRHSNLSETDKRCIYAVFDKLKPGVDPADDDFGAVLNCAVRYAIGRRTYLPSLVIEFVTPLLTQLSDTTLWCFDQDIEEARYRPDYGDPKVDEPEWEKFHEAVKTEIVKRGEEARGERKYDADRRSPEV